MHDWAVASGLADPAACVLEGWSWGGYLTLLGLGRQPERWAVGCAGVPVADYLAAYEDEMEPLRAFDRSLFGGSPERCPSATSRPRRSRTWTRCGPRCSCSPARTTRAARSARSTTTSTPWRSGGGTYAMVRYDAGHGSLVVAETLRHTVAEIAFARRALGGLTRDGHIARAARA